MKRRAIDVSRHQGDGTHAPLPDYDKIPKDIVEVFARLSVGTYYVDKTYEHHRTNSDRTERHFGAYTVYHPNYTPKDTIEYIKPLIGNSIPKKIVIDLEKTKHWTMPSKDIVRARTYEFCCRLTDKYHEALISIYTARWYWDVWIGNDKRFLRWPLHVANYPYAFLRTQYHSFEAFEKSHRRPSMPLPWTDWTAWQFSEKGRVAGIASKSTDLNIVKYTGEEEPIPISDKGKLDILWKEYLDLKGE